MSDINSDSVQCESKKNPCGFRHFLPNGWEFLINFLHTYYAYYLRWITYFHSIISNFDKVMPH